MERQKTRNTLFGLLIIGLLAVTAQDALAQRPVANGERRNDAKRPARTMIKKDKMVKESPRQTVRKKHKSKPVRAERAYSKNDNRRKHYRNSKRDRRSYKGNRTHAYKVRDRRQHFPVKRAWYSGHNRRPSWVDYHRPGYRYPKVGMHVSVLPHGYISLAIGNLRFYARGGVYYRYDPMRRVYFVVTKPRFETRYTSATWDRIVLMDGSTIEGVYNYSDNDIVFFDVGDAQLEIPMSEIKVLYLSQK